MKFQFTCTLSNLVHLATWLQVITCLPTSKMIMDGQDSKVKDLSERIFHIYLSNYFGTDNLFNNLNRERDDFTNRVISKHKTHSPIEDLTRSTSKADDKQSYGSSVTLHKRTEDESVPIRNLRNTISRLRQIERYYQQLYVRGLLNDDAVQRLEEMQRLIQSLVQILNAATEQS